MDKDLFHKLMVEFAVTNNFEWSEENEDNFIWDGTDNYVAIWNDGDGTFSVESFDYTKDFNDIEGAKEDVLMMIDVIREQENKETANEN